MTEARPIVMHVITGLRTGGAERALLRLVGGGLAREFDTHIVSMEDEGTVGPRLRDANATVHILKVRDNPVAAFRRLRQLAATLRPAVVQGWMYHGNLGALAAAGTVPGGVPALFNIRQGLDDIAAEKPITRQVIRLNRLLSRRPVQILYNSHRSRDQHQTYGFSSRKSRVIPNGFELDQFLPDDRARAAVRRAIGIKEDAVVVGNFARFHPMKDHAGLLRAANMALGRGLDAHFLLTGRGVSFQSLEFADNVDEGWRNRFHIFGDRPDVAEMMQAIDIYASSSAWGEGFPNVIGEAMASSRPCIGTDVGDTGRVIGDSGFVVPPSDSGALADALVTLGGDAVLRARLGRRARNIIEDKFDVDAVANQYINLYFGVIRDAQKV